VGHRRTAATGWDRSVTYALKPTAGRACGIDVGVAVFAAVADGDGAVELVENPRLLAHRQRQLSTAQRAPADCKKTGRREGGRRNRAKTRVLAAHRAVREARRNLSHQLSSRLVRDFDLIALEDLAVSAMTRSAKGTPMPPGTNVAQKAGLNRSILDAGWGQLARNITYKAESAGRSVVRVRALYTSQTCAVCGHTDTASRVSREHFCCVECGHDAHADANAAAVILPVATGLLRIEAPRPPGSPRPGSGHRSATAGRDAA
jgi:putative transposase